VKVAFWAFSKVVSSYKIMIDYVKELSDSPDAARFCDPDLML
jgi:hypothetical protein